MRILVIGGTGFIGWHIVKELIHKGHEAGIVALPPADPLLFNGHEVCIHHLDIARQPDDAILRLFERYQAFIFAAGADDRTLPRKPAWNFFYEQNVKSLTRLIRLASKTGVQAALVMGSYFTTLSRKWSEMNLATIHPYIHSREVQQLEGFLAAGETFRLIFLELPFIFGTTPGKVSMWKPLIGYLNSGWPLFYPPGGTAAVAVKTVAEVAVSLIVDENRNGVYPLAQKNYSWQALFRELLRPLHKESRKMYRLPRGLFNLGLNLYHIWVRIKGREGGLNFRSLAALLCKPLYLNSSELLAETGVEGMSLEQAFSETVAGVESKVDRPKF